MKKLDIVSEAEILGRKIRAFGNVEEPLFLAADVAEWIDYAWKNDKKTSRQTSKMLLSIDDDEKMQVILGGNICNSKKGHGGIRENTMVWAVTEYGLYEACMRSTKPIAKQMRKQIKAWLKQLRLTGGVVADDREAEFVEKYFPAFTDDTKLAMVEDLLTQNKKYKKQVQEMTPKAEMYDCFINSDEVVSVNVASKELGGYGEKKLYKYLRDKNVVFLKDGINVPYQNYVTQGYFTTKEKVCRDGKTRAITYVTKPGLEFIKKMMKKDGLGGIVC